MFQTRENVRLKRLEDVNDDKFIIGISLRLMKLY